MTITIGTIRQWQPAALEEAVRTLLGHRDALTSLQDEVNGSAPPSSWHGNAADQAGTAHRKLDESAQRLTGEVASVWAATLDAADSLAALHGALAEAENLAHHHELTISDDGTVAKTGFVGIADLADVPDPDPERNAVRIELRDRVGELVRRAEDIDGKLARELATAHDDLRRIEGGTLQEAAEAGAHAGDLEVTPPPNSTAGANAAWWKSLSPADQDMVMTTKPDWIGNLDGVPAWDRHRANFTRLNQLDVALREELKALPVDDKRASTVQEKLNAIKAVQTELAREDKNKGGDGFPRQLLMLDVSGDFPKAAVATGDVDKAQHVAVQTPGIRSTVAGALAGNQAEMTALYKDSNGTVAGISWIGYEPPQTLNAGTTISDEKAKAGADDLARFYQGINASRGELPDPHLTALGHSYGGVTTEYALTKEGTGVDDAVVYGTPGHPVDDVNNLQIPQDSFYTLSSDNTPEEYPVVGSVPGGDWWEWIGGDGGEVLRKTGPVTGIYLPDGVGERGDIDGAQELSADAVEGHSRGVTNHSDYMNRGTTSYNNVLDVTTGNTDELIRKEI